MKSAIFRVVIISVLFNVHQIFVASFIRRVDQTDELFPVSIIHINDFHARFEETNEQATTCKDREKCIGGYARAVTVIKHLQKSRVNPIYLNAGDNFQGTLWYSLGGWNVTAQFLNMLNADAITLGNHEFDRGIAEAVSFMENLESPVIVANIDDSNEPKFQGKYQNSIVIDRNGRKIGVIGVILSTVDEIARTENLRFYDEIASIRREATLLQEQGVDIIIVLSHCGLDIDYKIAKETAPFVDVIVGGHTHTFMYTVEEGKTSPGPDIVQDVYPAVVESGDGHKVLIVQASAYMKYVGDLTVLFDKRGRVVSWEAQPIYLDNYIEPDSQILAAIQPWKKIIDAKGMRTVGETKVTLQQVRCGVQECNLGNFIADALVHYYVTSLSGKNEPWDDSIIALVPFGSMRATLNAGPITYNDLATIIPFENSIDVWDLRGDHVKEIFEHAVDGEWKPASFDLRFFTQVSGARVVYNMTNKPKNRVVSIDVITIENHIPKYKPLDPRKYYRCVSSSYLAAGGDGFHMIPKYKQNHKKGLIDIDVIMQYLKDRKVIYTGLDNRIKIVK